MGSGSAGAVLATGVVEDAPLISSLGRAGRAGG